MHGFMKFLYQISSWFERGRNRRHFRKFNKQYEEGMGANLRYVEEYLRNRK